MSIYKQVSKNYSHMYENLFKFLWRSLEQNSNKAWTDKFRIVGLFQNACVCVFYAAPRIAGQCEFVSSTTRSVTFRWTSAKSATSYKLVGHSVSASTGTNTITVNGLTPGSHYTFTVWAVGWQGLRSNNISCTGSTGLSEIFIMFLSDCFMCFQFLL